MSGQALQKMFGSYGDAGGHWTGGDSTVSVPLPDGRIAWLFSDTFLGTVNADGSRPDSTPMVNNTIVIQEGTSLVSTRHGGTATAPHALVRPTQPGEFFWVADGTVENGALRVLYNRYRRTGPGPLDVALTGNSLATFTLPALTLTSVTDLPFGDAVIWGAAILEDGDHTYIYGATSSGESLRFGHVARVPAGGLDGQWQFWNGSAWSSSSTDLAPLLSGVDTAYAVQKVDDGFVLVTQDANQVFNPQFVAYTAPGPTGPFSGPVHLVTAPEQEPGSEVIVYLSRLHADLAAPGKLLMSYDVNSLENADNFADVSLYRPRFVEVSWPPATPDPAVVPAAPTGLTVTSTTAGTVTLAWPAAPGADRYWVHQRDVTAGQTHFTRLRDSVPTPSREVEGVKRGHTYEFKVTAGNRAGTGPFSTVVTAIPQISAPPAPTGVAAVTDSNGRVTVSWSPVSGARTYEVLRRNISAGETVPTPAGRADGSATFLEVNGLEHGNQYEFTVVAIHRGGRSPASWAVGATPFYTVPGAPTGLTARPNADGTIALSWSSGGAPTDWYWVYLRDVTAAETEFTKLSLPITQCCTMNAGPLLHGHLYEFKITASNRGGESPASATVQGRSTHPVPTAPANLSATPANGEVALSWTASRSADVWYRVYLRNVTTGESDFTKISHPVSNCCTMTARRLANGNVYEFKVTAFGQGGESPSTTVVSATPQAPPPWAPATR